MTSSAFTVTKRGNSIEGSLCTCMRRARIERGRDRAAFAFPCASSGKTESEVRRLRRRMLKAKWQATNSDKNFVYGVYANREPRTRLRGCCATRSSTKYHAVKTTIKIPELAELGQALFINQAEPENRVNSLKRVRCIPRRVS